ncbi:hypothetical protein MDOR_10270 [Mycolicibacterium doricum]|uniref:Immunity protein 52 domain-containing protein n=1 Tax=Mycolicibacterium doricum TaxID=126673 RepID=A0A7I7VTQ6_9MYCO|nr:Imm52 family immunity protein [Mycolicibacterium doricum]MCV7269450.1 hypothetical protein [Mycolicibacterium doricum]BBZ06858.1 hypothetical protein MDOR_10270 [Mycolicibacterium doricum]
MSKSYVGGYWGPRPEGIESCARRLSGFLKALADIDALLTEWRNKGKTKRQAESASVVTTNYDDLVERLLAGVNRRDDNQQVIGELGSTVSWWNAAPSRAAATLSIGCGAEAPNISNWVVLNLPDSREHKTLYEPATAKQLVKTIIKHFEPDWAVFTNNGLVDRQREPNRQTDDGRVILGQLNGRPAGWANYTKNVSAAQVDHLNALPPSTTVEPAESGVLITTGNNPADPDLHDVLALRPVLHRLDQAIQYLPTVPHAAGRPSATKEGAATQATIQPASPPAADERGTTQQPRRAN